MPQREVIRGGRPCRKPGPCQLGTATRPPWQRRSIQRALINRRTRNPLRIDKRLARDGSLSKPVVSWRTHYSERVKLEEVLRSSEERLDSARATLAAVAADARQPSLVRLFHQLQGARATRSPKPCAGCRWKLVSCTTKTRNDSGRRWPHSSGNGRCGRRAAEPGPPNHRYMSRLEPGGRRSLHAEDKTGLAGSSLKLIHLIRAVPRYPWLERLLLIEMRPACDGIGRRLTRRPDHRWSRVPGCPQHKICTASLDTGPSSMGVRRIPTLSDCRPAPVLEAADVRTSTGWVFFTTKDRSGT